MQNPLIRIVVVLALVVNIYLGNMSESYAQAGGNEQLDGLVTDSKNDLLVVVGGGLAGAVLGLSTLSFVEEPKKHTKNIIVGASIGIIVGVGFVAFSQANRSRELIYDEEGAPRASLDSRDFGTYARSDWHQDNTSEYQQSILTPYSVGYSFKF